MATKKNEQIGCRIRLVREGFEFEAEGDRAFVHEMIQRFASGARQPASSDEEGRVDPAFEGIAPPLLPPSKAISIREFLGQLAFQKHTDFVVAFGYYLEKYAGHSGFAPADLNSLYYEAKLDTSNTSQMIILNIKRGYLMEAKKTENGGRKQYILTNSGEKFIEDRLQEKKS